jgi:hypothetical protein
MGLITLCAGWLMSNEPVSGRAEASQPVVRAAARPAGVSSAPVEVAPPVAKAIPGASLIHAEELAKALAGPAAQRPAVLHVGFRVLYRSGHIAGSPYIGPASKPEGLMALRKAVRKLPRSKAIVLYCGCCPWTDCPNVRPAFAAAESTGRTVKILYIAKNLQKDWIDAGLPTESGNR